MIDQTSTNKSSERDAARQRAEAILAQETFEVRVERLVEGGLGFARVEGFLVLIPRAAPGDLLEVKVFEKKRDYARAEIVKVVEPGPDRVDAPCPVYDRCGGCDLQHIASTRQTSIKVASAVETLRRLGGIEVKKPKTISGSPFGYRSRAQLQVRGAGNELEIGFFERSSNQLVPTLSCPILVEGLDRRLGLILQALRAESVESMTPAAELDPTLEDEALDPALDQTTVSEDVEAETDSLSSEEGVATDHETATGEPDVAKPVDNGVPSRLDLLLGDGDDLTTAPATESLPHRPVVREVGGIEYELDARCFFQGHDELVEQLVEVTMGRATDGESGEIAFELHSGVGLFTLPLAKRSAQVFAAETDRIAARYLRKNAKRNGIKNIELSPTSAEHFLKDWQKSYQSAEAKGEPLPPRADRWLVDPPRTGLSKELVHAACRHRPKRITYVSCQPPTLARDLKALHRFYVVDEVTFLDLFPQTAHIETVVQLVARAEPLPAPEPKPMRKSAGADGRTRVEGTRGSGFKERRDGRGDDRAGRGPRGPRGSRGDGQGPRRSGPSRDGRDGRDQRRSSTGRPESRPGGGSRPPRTGDRKDFRDDKRSDLGKSSGGGGWSRGKVTEGRKVKEERRTTKDRDAGWTKDDLSKSQDNASSSNPWANARIPGKKKPRDDE